MGVEPQRVCKAHELVSFYTANPQTPPKWRRVNSSSSGQVASIPPLSVYVLSDTGKTQRCVVHH